MVLITRNDCGRIFVRDFEIEKTVYLFIKEFYPQLDCYAVEYQDNILNIYVHNSNANVFGKLDNFQQEAQKYFQEKMGIYIKVINLNIK